LTGSFRYVASTWNDGDLMPAPSRYATWCATAIVAALIVAGCSAPQEPQGEDAGKRLNEMVEQYFDELLPLDPLYATFIGENRYNDKLAIDISPKHIARRRELEERYLTRAQAVQADALGPQDRLTLDVFLRERTTMLKRMTFPGHLLPLDQLYSLPSVFAQFGSGTSAQPFSTVQDYDNFLGRMRDFAVWATQAIENMRAGMKAGVVQPKVVMRAVQPQLDELSVEDPTQSIFYQPITHLPASFSRADRERLTMAYTATIHDTLLPAYRRLAEFVRREYLPAARDSVAWSALPDGESWYRFLTATMTTTQLSPDEIHELGLSEVARIRAEMEQVKTQVGFEGDLPAFFKHLETDPAFYFASATDLLQGYRDLKSRIDSLVPKLFATMPAVDYEVREVESFRAQSAAGASYQPPAPDGVRPGIFYVNTWNLRAQPRFGMETLSLHEASPGHHFQQAIQLSLDKLPRFRRFGGDYVAYTEGWALYAESLGKELGLFTDPYQYYGRLSDEMLRAMRLVVDTGVHSRNWTRAQAISYMLDNSSMAQSEVESEVDRYIANPGQALGYKIGQIRIRALRARAEAALGERFDVRKFHDEILRDGALPIDVLEAKMDRWLATEEKAE
jgi:uncharacterized protein (DUF885 family)